MIGRESEERFPKELISGLAKAGVSSANDFTYAPGRNGLPGLVFPVVMGDTAHAEKPVFIVSQAHTFTRVKLRNRDEQIGIARSGRYLLIAAEYSGDDPTVTDLKTNTTLISKRAHAAVWVPTSNSG
jgi:hypothetical protein